MKSLAKDLVRDVRSVRIARVDVIDASGDRFANDGERLAQQIVERLALLEPLAEFDGLAAQLLVGERLDRRFECTDVRDDRPQALELTLVGRAEDFREGFIDDHRGWISADCTRTSG